MVAAPINHISLDERGVAYISGTRIKVRDLAVERNVWKKPPEAIQQDFPQLSLGQIYAALAYYCDHQEQIDAEIAAEERFTEQMRSQQAAPLTRQALLERLQQRATEEQTR
jgi:uncharacterized protein (DUF433 family)